MHAHTYRRSEKKNNDADDSNNIGLCFGEMEFFTL